MSIWLGAYFAAFQEKECSFCPPLLKVGMQVTEMALTGKDSSQAALWGHPGHCGVSSVPSYWGAPCGSYTAVLGRVQSGQTLSLSREATGH